MDELLSMTITITKGIAIVVYVPVNEDRAKCVVQVPSLVGKCAGKEYPTKKSCTGQ
jgi:hypothetical protein